MRSRIRSFKNTNPLFLGFCVLFMFIFLSCSEKLAKEIRTYENGALQTIEYLDIHGNIVERLRISGEKQILREEYVYIDNKIRAAQFTADDENKSSVEYFYENEKLMRIRYFTKGSISRLIIFRYDEYERLFSEMHFDLRNELRNAVHFHNDTSGICIAKVIVTKDSLPIQEFYSFDKNNNIISSVSIYGNDTIKMTANAYNKKDQLIESVEYQYGSLVKKARFTYNSAGNMTKILYLDSHGYIVREEKTEYYFNGRPKKTTITDYRNFENDGAKVVDVLTYKYLYF